MPGFELAGRGRASGKFWGVVLAGGHGVRLQPFVRQTFGLDAPKQYVAFMGRRSMFQHTLDRAAMFIPDHRILSVTDARHFVTVARADALYRLVTGAGRPWDGRFPESARP